MTRRTESEYQMTAAIMQPYFFPYLGYFQLIQAVDTFVLFDDVSFIKGGWINRNYVSIHGHTHRITLNLSGASSNKNINDIETGDNKARLLETLRQGYSRAPHFKDVFPLLKNTLENPERNLADYLDFSLKETCDFIGISTAWQRSSRLPVSNSLRGSQRVIEICKHLGATHYVNAPGGRDLYNSIEFANNGIRLSFLEPNKSATGSAAADRELSIIDLLMQNGPEATQRMVEDYDISD